MTIRTVFLVGLLAGCAAKTQAPPASTVTFSVQPAEPSEPSEPAGGGVVISEADDGSMVVSLGEGGQTWPPMGEGCDVVVSCCQAMWVDDPAMELACKLGATTHALSGATSCDELFGTVTAMYQEMGNAQLPAVCTP